MTLQRETDRIPTAIGDIRVTLDERIVRTYLEGGAPGPDTYERKVIGEIVVLDQNGLVIKVWTGDLLPHLTNAQKSWLLQFILDIRAQAVAELLPTIP